MIFVRLDTHYLLIKSVSIVAVAKAVTPLSLKFVMDVIYPKLSTHKQAHASIPHALTPTANPATSMESAKVVSKGTPFTAKSVLNAPMAAPHARKPPQSATREPATQVSSSIKIPKTTQTTPV